MKKSLALVFAVLTLPLCLYGQGARHDNVAYQYIPNGNTNIISSIPNALITVCVGNVLPAPGNTCTGLASIFSDDAMTQALQNPTNADGFGNYGFYTPAGSYIVSVSGVGLVTYSYPLKLPCTLDGNCTFTGNITFTGTVNIPGGTALILPLPLTKDTFTNFLTAVTLTGARTWTLQDASDTFVFRSTVDVLTNKTIDASVNTLDWSSNTAGHYLRNNGTKYVDSAILSADVPPIDLSSSGNGGVVNNLPVTNLAGGAGASSSTCWFGDASWKNCLGSSTFAIKTASNSSICTTGNNSYDQCPGSVTFSPAFADANYSFFCTPETPNDLSNAPNNGRAYFQVVSHNASSVSFMIVTTGAAQITWAKVTCTGIHL